jgi:hypothetical protein
LRAFWEALYSYLSAHGHSWAQGKQAKSQNFINSAVGKDGVYAYVSCNRATSLIWVGISLEGSTAKRRFDLLAENQTTIEAEFPGEELSRDRRDNKVDSYIAVCHPYNQDNISTASPEREALFAWIATNMAKFRAIAKQYLVDRPIA